MTSTDLQAYALLVMVLKVEAPYDTGRLSQKGIRMVDDSEGMHLRVGHDSDREFADYAIYTEEPWVSPKWNGKKNPNEGWIERAIMRAKPMIEDVYKGMDVDAFNALMDDLQLEYNKDSVRAHNKGGGLR